jgi:hypothetical protein
MRIFTRAQAARTRLCESLRVSAARPLACSEPRPWLPVHPLTTRFALLVNPRWLDDLFLVALLLASSDELLTTFFNCLAFFFSAFSRRPSCKTRSVSAMLFSCFATPSLSVRSLLSLAEPAELSRGSHGEPPLFCLSPLARPAFSRVVARFHRSPSSSHLDRA